MMKGVSMADKSKNGDGFFRALTAEEKANLRDAVKYGIAIFAAVSITLIVVAVGASIISG